MIVGTAVPTIIVGTTVPPMIAETNISLEAVPTTLVGIAVLTSIVGTTVSTLIAGTKKMFQQFFLEQLFLCTNVVGTTVYINALKRLFHYLQNGFNVFYRGNEQKNII